MIVDECGNSWRHPKAATAESPGAMVLNEDERMIVDIV